MQNFYEKLQTNFVRETNSSSRNIRRFEDVLPNIQDFLQGTPRIPKIKSRANNIDLPPVLPNIQDTQGGDLFLSER